MELLKIRGPAAHQSGLAHSVFQLLRLHSAREGRSSLLVMYELLILITQVFQNILFSTDNFLVQND
jgi:hypothetical protein